MAIAKVQVLVTLDGDPVWRVVAPLDAKVVRRLTKKELESLSEAIPALIESLMAIVPVAAEPVPNRKRK